MEPGGAELAGVTARWEKGESHARRGGAVLASGPVLFTFFLATFVRSPP